MIRNKVIKRVCSGSKANIIITFIKIFGNKCRSNCFPRVIFVDKLGPLYQLLNHANNYWMTFTLLFFPAKIYLEPPPQWNWPTTHDFSLFWYLHWDSSNGDALGITHIVYYSLFTQKQIVFFIEKLIYWFYTHSICIDPNTPICLYFLFKLRFSATFNSCQRRISALPLNLTILSNAVVGSISGKLVSVHKWYSQSIVRCLDREGDYQGVKPDIVPSVRMEEASLLLTILDE